MRFLSRCLAVVGRTWRFIASQWLYFVLPPTMFLLAAGVAHQVLRARKGYDQTFTNDRNAGWQEQLRNANKVGAAGDKKAALEEVRRLANTVPADAESLAQLAQIFERLGEMDRAVEFMERAIRLAPESESKRPRLLLSLAGSYLDMGRFDKVKRLLCEDIFPHVTDTTETAQAHFLQGLLHLRHQEGDDSAALALASLERCLELKPERSDARYEYGVCLAQLGKLDQAEAAFAKVLEANPKHSSARHELGEVLRRQGRIEESRTQIELFTAYDAKERRKRYLEVQIGLDQAASAYFLELGGLYLELDDLVRAEGAFRRYILRVSTDARGHRGLAETYRRLDRLDEAKSSDELAAALESRTDVDGGATDIRDDINGSELKGEP